MGLVSTQHSDVFEELHTSYPTIRHLRIQHVLSNDQTSPYSVRPVYVVTYAFKWSQRKNSQGARSYRNLDNLSAIACLRADGSGGRTTYCLSPHLQEYTRSVFVQVISSLMLNLWYEMKPPELES
ncbi:hypothetical protein ANN_12043 [Periplaneta americana]|uniref:Uncharacterized protein n=1 Tax=Periplaneta americana TaxID=6978 RepID=A0ABQ8T8K5_PERAM|nr:hypothetical protein ANN_12043 [Periplaneta americana]